MRLSGTALLLLALVLGLLLVCAPARVYAEEDDHDHDDHDDHDDDHKGEEGHDDHDDHHDHDHAKCACVAKQYGVGISCTPLHMLSVEGAVKYLEDPANNCNKTDACPGHYFILQSHHDFCPHDVLPTDAEKVLHDFEDAYEDCFIQRQFDSSLTKCPATSCDDKDLFTKAAETLESNNCKESCGSQECIAAIQTILMGHDTCEESQLPEVVEKALHDYEDACEDNLCNTADDFYNPNEENCEGFEINSANNNWVQAQPATC